MILVQHRHLSLHGGEKNGNDKEAGPVGLPKAFG